VLKPDGGQCVGGTGAGGSTQCRAAQGACHRLHQQVHTHTHNRLKAFDPELPG